MDRYREEIFRLYITEKKTMNDVMEILKRDHGLQVKPRTLRHKLCQWGYMKNLKRAEVVEILRQVSSRDSAGKDSVVTLRQRPVDLERVRRHEKRAGLQRPMHAARGLSLSQPVTQPGDAAGAVVVCRTPPPALPRSLPVVEGQWKISEKLLHDVDTLVKGSFEAMHWSFDTNKGSIRSSPRQVDEMTAWYRFEERSGQAEGPEVGAGSRAGRLTKRQRFAVAGGYWREAFTFVERLVQGQHHAIIPNLIMEINDLNREPDWGKELANKLRGYIVSWNEIIEARRQDDGNGGRPNSTALISIYHGLGQSDMDLMVEIEERIVKRFGELFELYLGTNCYASFSMKMVAARRRLLRHPWAALDECLPASLSHLDHVFGLTDQRSLDVIRLRLETLESRGFYEMVEVEATDLIRRAEMIQGNDWLRLSNLCLGWELVNRAQVMLGKYDLALADHSESRFKSEFARIDAVHPPVFTSYFIEISGRSLTC
ncbi:hypothetical protein QBC46DRAFT_417323 [Diplogelasinospora grovesii]|uniref:Clr5 domain-containing protein n=1 Tax=Diplogelasinospora grovesii TaxID=303347 RepID=A0AAN6S1H6_9PEZI|nr:hypothetical protein QBC46DRAFT_417323 [Diplogelasinospora grovesii]